MDGGDEAVSAVSGWPPIRFGLQVMLLLGRLRLFAIVRAFNCACLSMSWRHCVSRLPFRWVLDRPVMQLAAGHSGYSVINWLALRYLVAQLC